MSHGHDVSLPAAPARITLPLPVWIASGAAVLAGAAAFFWALKGGHRDQAWGGFLMGSFLALSLGVFGVLWLSILNLTKAVWAVGLRRIAEAMTFWIVPGGLLALLVVLGAHDLYHWSHAEAVAGDALLTHKAPFLNLKMFVGLAGGSFLLWAVFGGWMTWNSGRQDATGSVKAGRLNLALSAIFAVLFALSYSAVSFLYLMSLEPHWFSTMFAVLTFTDLMQAGLAFFCLVAAWIVATGRLKGFVGPDHLHGAGKMLFAVTGFWAYIYFCQFLLIWYANLPEETTYFLRRMENGWMAWMLVLPVIKFVVPFVFMVPRESKRRPGRIAFWAVWILVAQAVELFLMVAPSLGHGEHAAHAHAPIVQGLITLGFLGAFTLVFAFAYSRRNPVPLKDGKIAECIHYHAA
jgi:hypothetical protein